MELRKDYILDRWIIISERRKERPKQFKREHKKEEGICVFCKGNESMTPEEIGRVDDGSSSGSWKARWFANKFAFVSPDEDPKVKTDGKLFTHGGSYGYHEVIAETPEHDKQMWDLNAEDIEMLLRVYKSRVEELSKKENINYVVIFKNHGPEGGTSLVHSHTQVVAFSHIPPIVREKIDALAEFAKSEPSSCAYCKIADIESKSTRRCFENEHAVAFTPYASRFNYEVWIMPKRHAVNFKELSESETKSIAGIMHNALLKLKEIDASFNILFFYSPEGENMHFHIEILPRIATWAGFEFSTDIVINSVSPETAAKFYRGDE